MSEVPDSVAVIDQIPQQGEPLTPQTPLHHTARAGGDGQLHYREHDLTGLLVLRGNAADKAFAEVVKATFGCSLPKTLSFVTAQEVSLLWLSPDEWWVLCPPDQTYALEVQLRERYSGHFALANNTGGMTRIQLSGPQAVQVLKKSIPYDVHDDHFPVGKVVATVFGKTQAVVRRLGQNDWEILARRSFADYIWRWVEDAASEYQR